MDCTHAFDKPQEEHRVGAPESRSRDPENGQLRRCRGERDHGGKQIHVLRVLAHEVRGVASREAPEDLMMFLLKPVCPERGERVFEEEHQDKY